jgi:hypothetical protein
MPLGITSHRFRPATTDLMASDGHKILKAPIRTNLSGLEDMASRRRAARINGDRGATAFSDIRACLNSGARSPVRSSYHAASTALAGTSGLAASTALAGSSASIGDSTRTPAGGAQERDRGQQKTDLPKRPRQRIHAERLPCSNRRAKENVPSSTIVISFDSQLVGSSRRRREPNSLGALRS